MTNLWWSTTDGNTVRLYLGDAVEVLCGLPAESVHCCVTSPPYWGLRDYKTGAWVGGDSKCKHNPITESQIHSVIGLSHATQEEKERSRRTLRQNVCECGAKRIDKQLGSEPYPDCGTHGQARCGGCFVCSMVAVFREVRRVLRNDGTLWLNLGDTYAGGGGYCSEAAKNRRNSKQSTNRAGQAGVGKSNATRGTGLLSGNLVGIPWRVAFALQADGWVLRQDIIWSKSNPMPESMKNRCTKAHEYIFLLTKSNRYYYDAKAIKEKAVSGTDLGILRIQIKDETGMVSGNKTKTVCKPLADGIDSRKGNPSGQANKRSVWTVATQGYSGAHFAIPQS